MPRPAPILAQKTAQRLLAGLGSRIRHRRESLGVSQREAAEAAGMSRPTLSRIERGNPSVTVGAYVAAAAVLGLTFSLSPSDETEKKDETLPIDIDLSRYPLLRQAAWHIPGEETVSPQEAFEIYERNWRHIDAASLTAEERALVRALSERFGGGRSLV